MTVPTLPQACDVNQAKTMDPRPLLDLLGEGVTDNEAGELLGVSRRTIWAWRHGKRRISSIIADRAACLLGRHPCEIWDQEWWLNSVEEPEQLELEIR